MTKPISRRAVPPTSWIFASAIWLTVIALALSTTSAVLAQAPATPQGPAAAAAHPIIHKIQGANERLEMVVNTSRILSLDNKVPKVLAANPDIVQLTPLSATEVQVLAKKAGVTQVNLWDDKDQIHTVDVIVYGDTRELSMLLQSQFPTTSLKVVPTANSVIISGHVDDVNQISRIVAISKEFYPNVINNITVAGVQQVLLKVKVMEVARSKVRKLGIDMRTSGTNQNNFAQTGVSQLLGFSNQTSSGFIPNPLIAPASDAIQVSFGVLTPESPFFGVLNALRKEQLASVLAEPNLVAYSGRPARFNSGGEFPITVPQSLGTVSIQFKPYGTQVEFVPIVLGDGAIRLEVYPRVSEIDETRSVNVNGTNVPALKVREANTGVEMRAGQTLAIAGLVQVRRANTSRKIPWLGELPYIGALFRNMDGEDEEVELLLLVTPELVAPLEPCQVPPSGPGLQTSNPSDTQFYLKGHIEVPRCEVDDACAPSRSPGSAYEYTYGAAGAAFDQGAMPYDQPIGPGGPQDPMTTVRRPGAASGQNAVRISAAPTRPAARLPGARPTPGGAMQTAQRNNSYIPGKPNTPSGSAPAPARPTPLPGAIGPVGYDVKK
ncbi:MAG TPA: pilus assembly protein N-terminal domain-containing protein [Pirellulales bacterium]|jgi:pilus assembly protein CpaC